ncbi:MAG TPA: hypothetical protein VK363_13735 [Pyrinomonadaceae bacterium]|nr:hypothetical protein [Pyrinomonadaceae bacterium]
MMKKKKLIVTLLLLAFTTSALAIGSAVAQRNNQQGRAQGTISSPSGLKPKPADLDNETPPQPAQANPSAGQPAPQPESEEVPEHVVYGQVFRHLKELHEKAADEERQGRNGAHLRKLYKEMAKLDDHQAAQLDAVAAEANSDIEKLDKRALKIIGELRARHPEGKLAAGEQPPAPPAELYELSAKRRDRISVARERLRSALGEDEFARFNEFVRERVKPGIRRLGNIGAPPQGAN